VTPELPIHDGDLTIRRLRDERADFEAMARWRAQPHVAEWWDPDEPIPDADAIALDYHDEATPGGTTTGCIIELDGRPVGYLQFYRWMDFVDEIDEAIAPDPDSFGIDIHVGEPDLIGTGTGTRAVRLICGFLASERGATDVRLTTELENHRAQRAYEKAGFVKVRHVLDTDTRDGERVWCWLMRWDPPAAG
jgi:aminoglycoside 6'-N-acetyltransferase